MLDRPSPSADLMHTAAAAPLVMLPGTLSDARLFGAVLGHLDARATVPVLDGAESAAAVAQLILAQSPERISLCGFSLGAIVALEIIAQAPHRVERLALIGCNPGALSAEASAARAALDRAAFVSPEDPDLARTMAADASDGSWHRQTAITLSRADSRPRLSRIAVPTLVLCGADDRICPPEMSREIAAAIVGARLAIIADARHYVTLEQPERVADELAAWLAMPANPMH